MKALLIAWREVRWEVFLDRGSLLRTAAFVLVPIAFVLTDRAVPRGVGRDLAILGLAIQCVFFPALAGVALVASTFVAEKENGTILPLLAAPIRDIDVVLGKLLGMIVPVMAACVFTLAVGYGIATYRYGPVVADVLTPVVLYALCVLALLFLITAGSVTMIVAARVRSSRAAQQIAGLIIAASVAAFTGLGFVASQVGEGWGLLALGAGLVVFDALALEVARRAWQRGEVLARI